MKLMFNTYQIAQEWDVDRVIEICAATGYRYVEFLMDHEQAHGLEWDTPEATYLDVKLKLEQAGMAIGTLSSCRTFDSPDAAERAESVRRIKRVIDMARLVGCDHIRVAGDRLPPDESQHETALAGIGDCISELGRYASDDVKVSLEMHGSFGDPHYALDIMRRVALPNVGLIFNGAFPMGREWKYAQPEGRDPVPAFYELIRPYLTSIHFHQIERPDQLPHWQKWFRLLKSHGYAGYISNESSYTGPDPEKVLRLYTALFETLVAA